MIVRPRFSVAVALLCITRTRASSRSAAPAFGSNSGSMVPRAASSAASAWSCSTEGKYM